MVKKVEGTEARPKRRRSKEMRADDERIEHETRKAIALAKKDPAAPEHNWTPGRPRGTTAVHVLPVPIREEVHAMLASNYALEWVERWLVTKGITNITIRQLAYYRRRYVTPLDIMGERWIKKALERMGARFDPFLTIQAAIGLQLERIMCLRNEEKTMEGGETTMVQMQSELEVLDRLVARAWAMGQQMGIYPREAADFTMALQAQMGGGVGVTHAISPDETTMDSVEMFKRVVQAGIAVLAETVGKDEIKPPDGDSQGGSDGQVAVNEQPQTSGA